MAIALKDRLALQASGNAQLKFDPVGRDEAQLFLLPLGLIDSDPNQPRKELGNLTDLALSISEHGVLQPLIVEVMEGGRYRILVGERRFAASRSLGLATVPCIVRTVAQQSRLALQLIENLHRKDLHPLEEARAVKRLMDEFNLSQRDLAKRIGKSLTSTNETLRILDLCPEVQAEVRTSEHASKSVLLEIAKEPDATRQQELWAQGQAGQLTVRKARDKKQKDAGRKRTGTTHSIRLTDATVIVRFASGEAALDRVRGALESALLETECPAAGR